MKKSPGPDGIANEMLRHLGPIARSALLRLTNASWAESEVPREWRAATVIPIPKSGKDKRRLASYRPIALTSHVGKLAERMILARLTFLAEQRGLIPAEQVGFREHRSVEDHIGRLVQEVQDGWQRPKPRRPNQPDGSTAQKYTLIAFDFARAYDTVDHRLLRARLLELGLPTCLVTWVWQWLRDRRVRVEVNGALSHERVFRAGLPQGSVLSPSLFLLWAAPLAQALRDIPGTSPYMYADDTAALCAGNTIQVAVERAQRAADALLHWARRSKMTVSAEKTQMLVLSQWHRDAVDCTIKVAGKTIAAGDSVNLLGVTLDRLLHFGPHCQRLRKRVRPRINQLRQLSGRSWGLEEQQLRTVANGYVRGALEHAAAAWLPATPPSHVEVLEREIRAAARVVTGCPRSTPTHALMAEAGLAPVAIKRKTLAARLLAKATAFPPEDPLHRVAVADAPTRLSTVTGWRSVGREMWRAAGVSPPIEPILPPSMPPWQGGGNVTFSLDVGPLPSGASDAQKRQAATMHLGSLPQCATWVWSDGSADGGILSGGAGIAIEDPDGECQELRAPAGKLCSSFRAEMVALKTALDHLVEHPSHPDLPIVICTDSQSALAALRGGAPAQSSPLGRDIWGSLLLLASGGRRVHLQWVPSHCELPGNEHADKLAREASALSQSGVPVDPRTVYRAVTRTARARWISEWPQGWYRTLMGAHLPQPVTGVERSAAVDVHQIRAGHWSGSTQYMHRIGRSPWVDRGGGCHQCNDVNCRGALCSICREAADTPHHVVMECPALMATRFRMTGAIKPNWEEVRSNRVVAALGAAARAFQSREATSGLHPDRRD